MLLESISHYDSFFNNFSCDKAHHYEGEQSKDNKQTHSEYNRDNQTNQNSKIHTHLARVARLTPFKNQCNRRNVETTWSNMIPVTCVHQPMMIAIITATKILAI